MHRKLSMELKFNLNSSEEKNLTKSDQMVFEAFKNFYLMTFQTHVERFSKIIAFPKFQQFFLSSRYETDLFMNLIIFLF